MAVVLSGMRLKAIFIFHFQLFKRPGKEQKAFLSGTLVVGGSLWPDGRPLLRVFFPSTHKVCVHVWTQDLRGGKRHKGGPDGGQLNDSEMKNKWHTVYPACRDAEP